MSENFARFMREIAPPLRRGVIPSPVAREAVCGICLMDAARGLREQAERLIAEDEARGCPDVDPALRVWVNGLIDATQRIHDLVPDQEPPP